MKQTSTTQFVVLATILLLLAMISMPGWSTAGVVSAQGAPADITETPTEPPSPTPTDTAVPPTNTPTPTPTNTPVVPTDTPVVPTNTPTVIVTLPPDTPTPPPSTPVPIPEPVTVVLFGTGLAALSAAVASRRKKDDAE
ncbi:MAG: PEP-CTERM sorting domain-containing protein [Caldilineaceae bacterium]